MMISRTDHESEPVQPLQPEMASTSALGIPGPATNTLDQSPGGSHEDEAAAPKGKKRKRVTVQDEDDNVEGIKGTKKKSAK